MAQPPAETGALLDHYRRFEHALKRAGFLDENRKRASANWVEFANALGEDFFTEVRDSGAAATLIAEPPRVLMRDSMRFEPDAPAPITDVVELFTRGVCQVRHNYIHGEKFVDEARAERDAALVREALAVLECAAARHSGVAKLLDATGAGRR